MRIKTGSTETGSRPSTAFALLLQQLKLHSAMLRTTQIKKERKLALLEVRI
jgi:hypothetical protein